ncbi:hypothetical protein L1987_42569 [Smallanthus sonchifolius]|uniref:Uncharacterized protein n=1 Tax=Smallanthus sonchifolius TaxID=185202 RepID=A0ACB9GKD9_9ASTR|nr:hypothetical protein L1987_42569 [Smallanthus sonchifolius]
MSEMWMLLAIKQDLLRLLFLRPKSSKVVLYADPEPEAIRHRRMLDLMAKHGGVIAEHLSAEEVAGIKQGFDLMNTNKQGKINIVELKAGLQKLGQQITDADLQILMDAIDEYFDKLPKLKDLNEGTGDTGEVDGPHLKKD